MQISLGSVRYIFLLLGLLINIQCLAQVEEILRCARENNFHSCKDKWADGVNSITLDLLEKYVSLNKKSYNTEELQFSNGETTIDSVLYYLLEAEYILKTHKDKDDKAFYNFRKALSYKIPIELRSEIYKRVSNYLTLPSNDAP